MSSEGPGSPSHQHHHHFEAQKLVLLSPVSTQATIAANPPVLRFCFDISGLDFSPHIPDFIPVSTDLQFSFPVCS